MDTSQPALTGVVLTLALLAAACGGGGGDADEEPPTPAPSTSSVESPGASSGPTSAAMPGYLPVPEGIMLAEPGAMLELEESAVAAWEPREGLVGVVEVSVTRIEETTVQASLAGFDLEGDQQRSTPYFVRTRVTNVGDTDLGARQLPLYFLDNKGGLIAPTGVDRDFEDCPGSTLPTVFAPGDKARSCLIFLAPEGSTLQSVMFRPPEGVVPLQWRGKLSSLSEDGRDEPAASKKSGQRTPKGA